MKPYNGPGFIIYVTINGYGPPTIVNTAGYPLLPGLRYVDMAASPPEEYVWTVGLTWEPMSGGGIIGTIYGKTISTPTVLNLGNAGTNWSTEVLGLQLTLNPLTSYSLDVSVCFQDPLPPIGQLFFGARVSDGTDADAGAFTGLLGHEDGFGNEWVSENNPSTSDAGFACFGRKFLRFWGVIRTDAVANPSLRLRFLGGPVTPFTTTITQAFVRAVRTL